MKQVLLDMFDNAVHIIVEWRNWSNSIHIAGFDMYILVNAPSCGREKKTVISFLERVI